jgi:toxin ParE1/3/4
MEIIFTDRFLDRIEECADYIARDNIPTAIKWSREVFEQCEKLVILPESGRIVPEFKRPEIREIIHGYYRLVYEIKPKQIDMLTIWHTKQLMPDDSDGVSVK